MIGQVVLYALIPAALALIGGALPSLYVPKPKLVSTLQHFVAGVVFAAVAVELLPKIIGHGSPWTIGLGFVLGVVVMIGLHELAHLLSKKMSFGLIIGGGADLFIDGMLIGVAFLAGRASGFLIAVSLSLCAFFLNLTLASTLRQKSVARSVQILTIVLIAALLPLGAWVGGSIVSNLPSYVLVETLAFGVAALLYLAIEELLAEAHSGEHDSAFTSAAFFVGFLLILLFKM